MTEDDLLDTENDDLITCVFWCSRACSESLRSVWTLQIEIIEYKMDIRWIYCKIKCALHNVEIMEYGMTSR